MKKNLDKRQIRTFGLGLAVILTMFALWNIYKENTTLGIVLWIIGLLSAFSALLFPSAIKPVYFVFMKVAHILGWINTRILLGLIFYIIITPIGLVIRIIGGDRFGKKIELKKGSYWIIREKVKISVSSYEKQF